MELKYDDLVRMEVCLLEDTETDMSLVSGFECGAESQALSDYIKSNAFSDNRSGDAKVYVIRGYDKEGNEDFVGYYSLKMSSISIMPEKKELPLAQLSELAIDARFQNNGIGELIFEGIISQVKKVREIVACKGIEVFSLNERSTNFYKRMGFKELPDVELTPKDYFNEECKLLVYVF